MAAEGEARHLVTAVPAPFWHRKPAEVTEAGRGGRRQPRRSLDKVCAGPGGPSDKLENAEEVQEEEEEARRLLEHKPLAPGVCPVLPRPGAAREAARGATLTRAPEQHRWPPFDSSPPLLRRDPPRNVVPDRLHNVQFEGFEDMFRSELPGPSELAAMDHNLVTECLRHYNFMHPGKEYVPAPGVVTRYSSPHNGSYWTHGNFMAHPKRSGCFSFLPAPRTLFFYELVTKDDFKGVVSCTALDEPVTEAYSLFGFPLGWGTRRDGSSDCRCKTCYCLVDRPVPFVGKTFPCGHNKAECVCEMCHLHAGVLHPLPAEFVFGNGD